MRLIFSITLKPGVDDDLIAWIKQVDDDPANDRVRAGKATLRAGLGLGQPAQPVTSNGHHPDTARLERDVQALTKTVNMLVKEHSTAVSSPAVPDLQKRLEWIEEALNYLNAQLTNGAGQARKEEVANTPKATDEQLEKRSKRLKKAKW
jgi:hypothetical protein